MPAPRSHGFHERFHSSAVIQTRPRTGMMVSLARDARDTTNSASPTANSPTARMTTGMPSSSCGRPSVSRAWPVCMSMPTSPMARPNSRLDEPAQHRRAEHGGDGGEGEQHQREIIRRAELQRERDDDRRKQRQRKCRERAGDERSDRGGGERRRAAAVLRHLVALDGGDDGGILARRVEQDRRGRGAVHGAVIDAAEHDEGADRIELAGRRQQHRDGERRADAGQHADGGAERHADQRPQQIDGRERDAEAVEQGS